MHVEAWGLNHSLYIYRTSCWTAAAVAASFSLRPQDSLWVGAHDARLTGDVVDETPGCEVDRAGWSGVPDDLGDGVCPHHKPFPPLSRPFLLSIVTGVQGRRDHNRARKTGGGRFRRQKVSTRSRVVRLALWTLFAV